MEIIIVFIILAVVILFLITEWIPLEVLALLVLGSLVVTKLVSPLEALSGFSNPAVVTIWAVFILSGGLTRTGIANVLGRQLLKVAGRRKVLLIAVIMAISGLLSAFMNNVAVAALMLPVVMDVARKTHRSPSLLLMPLAFGCLLGGVTTMIGTPPNILVSEALRENGLTPFGLFDFTPLGLMVMVSGIVFVSFIGIRFLPKSGDVEENHFTHPDLQNQYHLEERLFEIKVPSGSALVDKTLSESRLGAALGLNVVGISRHGQILPAPASSMQIAGGDKLIVEGRLDRIEELNHWGQLFSEENPLGQEVCFIHNMRMAAVQLAADSTFIDQTLAEIGFRSRFGLNVVAIRRQNRMIDNHLKTRKLQGDDVLLVHGPQPNISAIKQDGNFFDLQSMDVSRAEEIFPADQCPHQLRVPATSRLVGLTVNESHLGDALDIQLLYVLREAGTVVMPTSDMRFEAGDRLVVSGASDMLAVFHMQSLKGEFVQVQAHPVDPEILESEQAGLMEVMLSPHSLLSGVSLGQLNFREKYGLTVLAIWRKGRAWRSNLRDMTLQFGDALLLFGHLKNLVVLGREPDFLVLTQTAQEVPRSEKAKYALGIMAAVLVPVILDWLPIYIAVVIGAALMVLTGCLTMEEAYRYIEWKAVFLIAGMLPLGTALDKSGAAGLLAEGVVETLGAFGPHAVLFGLLAVTFMATSIIPTAALVVLMTPIALNAAGELGLSPYALMMAIAMAASSSFTSPISHPANVMVMGPGGYHFIDYIKLGVPLTLLILAVLMVAIPVLWPLTP